MKSRAITSLGVCLWLASWPSWTWGQELLTWADCVREAAQHNPDLAAVDASVQQARFQHRASYGNFYPQLSFDSGYTKARVASGLSSDLSLGLTLSQNLFAGFRDKGQVEQTRAELEAAAATRHGVGAQVSFELKAAFAQLLFAQEQVQLAEAIAARLKENMGMVELRFEAGREHKGSFLRSEANFHEAAFEVEQAKRALVVAQQGLARVLGRTEAGTVRVTGNFDVTPPEETPDFSALARQTPAHQQPEAQLRAAQAAVTVARASFFPELSASGSLTQGGSDLPVDTSGWSAGLFLTLPLFSGGQDFYDLQGARANYRQAQETLHSVDNQLLLDLRQAFAQFQDAIGRAAVQEEFLQASDVRAEITRNLYTTGLVSFDDWDVIENDLISARKQTLASLRDRLIAEGAWELAQGKGAIPTELIR